MLKIRKYKISDDALSLNCPTFMALQEENKKIGWKEKKLQ